MEIKIDSTYKGTRILFADSAKEKRKLINGMIEICENFEFQEIMFPVIQKEESFASKVGDENQKMMFEVRDKSDRKLVLSPEYTAIVQQLALDRFKYEKDLKMFYVQECFRGENTQRGRWRQFTQFGVEIINPTKDYSEFLIEMATKMIEIKTKNFEVFTNAKRGLDYYKDGQGFEIKYPELGAQQQICGGGEYNGGIGFAIGVDRLLLTKLSTI